MPPAQLKQITSNPAAKQRLALSSPGALQYLAINTQRPALGDVRSARPSSTPWTSAPSSWPPAAPRAASLASTLITPGIPGRQQYDLYPAPGVR